MTSRSLWTLRILRLAGVGALCLALIVGLVFLARAASGRPQRNAASLGASGVAAISASQSSCELPTATPSGAQASPQASSLPTSQASDADAGWPQFGFDAQGRRCNPYEHTLGVHTAPGLAVAWADKSAPFVESSPVVAHGVLYIASDNPHPALKAYNATTGVALWSQPLSVEVETAPTTPAVANGVVFVGATDTLYAFDAATGHPLWNKATGNILQGAPVEDAGLVYISS